MKYVGACIVCNSKKMVRFKAVASPFIAERIWKQSPFDVEFLHCKGCGVAFFNPRPSNDELNVLYADYRGAEYQQARQKHEKEYTVEFNRMLGDCNLNLHRKTALSGIIKTHVDAREIRSVLDYGGDRGQFIPSDFFNAEKYVYDVSGIKPVAGVKTIKNLSGRKGMKFDFIMCCHLLEHVARPSEILDNIKRFAHKDTVFYFEVPYEVMFDNSDAIRSGNPKLAVFSFMALVPFTYNHAAALRPSIRIKMHEHITFFSEKSLARLLALNGFDIKCIETNAVRIGKTKSMNISCLGTLKPG